MKNEYYLKDFIYYLKKEKNLSLNTAQSYENDIRQYINYLKKIRDIEDIEKVTYHILIVYIKYMKKKMLSSSSISRKISAIKSFHSFCKLENIVKEDISLTVDCPKVEKRLPKVLSVEQVLRLLNTTKDTKVLEIRNKALLELIYGSGLRVSELLDIRLKDIHLNEEYIIIKGKGDKERFVPISKACIQALRKYMTESRIYLVKGRLDYLFFNAYGSKLSRQGFSKILKQLAKDANIEIDISPHMLRHSFATHLHENGCDLKSIQLILGHEDISTTQIYTHISKIYARKMFEKTHPNFKEDKDGRD